MSAAAAARLRKAARVILVGPPGCGKGTQTTRVLSRYPQLTALSSGDLLRQNVRAGTPIGITFQMMNGNTSGGWYLWANLSAKLMCRSRSRINHEKGWPSSRLPHGQAHRRGALSPWVSRVKAHPCRRAHLRLSLPIKLLGSPLC